MAGDYSVTDYGVVSLTGGASSGFLDGVNLKDMIGGALGVYQAREQAKIDTRLQASRTQADQYAETWRLQQSQQSQEMAESAGVPRWALQIAGILALGAVVYFVAR